MRRVRIASLIIVLALAGLTVVGAASSSSPTRTVPCDETIMQVAFPYENGYRLVLGVVSVPPAYLRQVVRFSDQAWPRWRKAGLVVRANSSVSISVPKVWRKRLAITWGNSPGVYSALRIVGCPSSANVGYAYAGGFHLSSRNACVPLIFRVGKRSTIVRFGLGQRCTR